MEQMTGDWIKNWRGRVGRRIKGRKLNQSEASTLLGAGESGTTMRGWERGVPPVPKSAVLAMMAIDAATWYEEQGYALPPPMVEIKRMIGRGWD